MNKLFSLFLIVFLGCKTNPIALEPPNLTREEFLAVPETLLVDSYELTLSTYIWRDFMPMAPPDGRPLIAIAYVTAIDTDSLETTLDADAIWLLFGNEIWKSWITDETSPTGEEQQNRIVRVAREGPKWGPDVFVEAVIRVIDSGGNPHLLRASNQYINETQ